MKAKRKKLVTVPLQIARDKSGKVQHIELQPQPIRELPPKKTTKRKAG